jgi:ribosomal protein L11 methyltransferase
MPWLQLALIADREQAALIEAALENGGALAVTIDAANDTPVPEQILEPAPNATPLWRQVRITALFDDDPQGTMWAENAAAKLGPKSLSPPQITILDDRPWERVWLEELEPMRFGRRLWICPHGQRPEVFDSENIIIDLDPGLAFGTGHHPTTALCLRWLDGLTLRDRTVLDFGCGSGILAIAALKLGARRVVAVDHDQQALDATIDNAISNGVIQQLEVAHPDQHASDHGRCRGRQYPGRPAAGAGTDTDRAVVRRRTDRPLRHPLAPGITGLRRLCRALLDAATRDRQRLGAAGRATHRPLKTARLRFRQGMVGSDMIS